MKHYGIRNIQMDEDELIALIDVLGYMHIPELAEFKDRINRIQYPNKYPDPLEEFHKTIAYYNEKTE
tara:strand:- start:791 stop:991 length:201 start_codon:yes stop_codon:yes gene_type:complete